MSIKQGRLVSRHVLIHFAGPRIDASAQMLELLEPEMLQRLDGLQAAGSAMAVGDDGVGRVELIRAQVQFGERDELCPLDVDDVELDRKSVV